MKRTLLWIALALLAMLAIGAGLAWPRAEMIAASSPAAYASTPDNIARGAYLARLGDCMACHTARGGAEYAGGRALGRLSLVTPPAAFPLSFLRLPAAVAHRLARIGYNTVGYGYICNIIQGSDVPYSWHTYGLLMRFNCNL